MNDLMDLIYKAAEEIRRICDELDELEKESHDGKNHERRA
jgi:hypothetical protein